jgi:hypothetical protein
MVEILCSHSNVMIDGILDTKLNKTCILYNQRDATYTMFFIIISALHVSDGFSRPSSGAYKTVCAALGIVMLSCCLPLVWMGWNCSA